MTGQDIQTLRAQYRDSYRRKTAERRAKGLCVKCGKRPPTPGRTRCEPCAAKKRPADRARHRRLTAERVAQGLCPRCGKRPPAPERSQCAPCLEKDAAAGRARDARLRTAGLPRRDPAREREYGRERSRRQAEARRAEGLCTACGKAPRRSRPRVVRAVPGETPRPGSREIRRRQGGGEALRRGPTPRPGAGPPAPGGRRRRKAWREAGLCHRCGEPPAVEGGTICTPCREKLRAKARRQYSERRARRTLHQVRKSRFRRPDLLRSLRRDPLQAAEPRGEARRRPPALCRAARQGRLRQLRQAGPRGCRVPGLLRRCTRPLRRTPGRRGSASSARRPTWGRDGLLRPLRRRQGRAPRPRGGIRRQACPLCRSAGRGAAASNATRRRRGWRAASPVRASTGRGSGAFRGIPVVGPELDGDRDRHRPRARHLRQRGRRGALPRLREARPRPGRSGDRRLAHELVHGAALVSPRGAAGAIPCCAAGPPTAAVHTYRRQGVRRPGPTEGASP